MHIRAWLFGLLLGAACMVAGAQPVPPPAGETAATGATAAANGLPSSIPLRREGGAPAVRDGQWAMAFWALLVLGGVAWVWARRRQKNPAAGSRGAWPQWLRPAAAGEGSGPQLKGQTRLTPRHSLHAVQWHGVEYLIACSDHGAQLIARHPPEANPSAGELAP